MHDPVILSACRTPIGKFQGALANLSAMELGAVVIRAAVERAGLSPTDVDEVIMGNVLSAGLGQAPARQAALRAGLPPTVAALTVNKVCGSGLKAMMLAAQAIRCGEADVVVAGGMESMSRAPYLLPRGGPKFGNRELLDSMLHDGLVCANSGRSMGDIAETLASSDELSRGELDALSAESHRRAVQAVDEGCFDPEIVPVKISTRSGEHEITRDEGPRAETSVDQLAALRPSFRADGVITAGNAAMISDGAAAVVMVSQQFATSRPRQPLARFVAAATAGMEPDDLFLAPVPAIEKVLQRAQRKREEIDLFEINEAFAVQMLACLRRLELPTGRVNVRGGAIALGHPIGASGARVAVTLIHALRQRQESLGIAALCLGGGNAVAAMFDAG